MSLSQARCEIQLTHRSLQEYAQKKPVRQETDGKWNKSVNRANNITIYFYCQ